MQVDNFHNKNMTVVYVENDKTTKYCPPAHIKNINLHPRVALKFIDGVARCPYCGVKFQQKDG